MRLSEPITRVALNILSCRYAFSYNDILQNHYIARHLIGDFRELIKIAKFNGRENGRKFVKL